MDFFTVGFVINSVLLGVGLAMDAFSVSIVNTMNEPGMHKSRMMKMAGVYAFFQFLMPMIGWVLVHTAAQYFRMFQKAIPWIALILLLFLGGNMLLDGIRKKGSEELEQAGAAKNVEQAGTAKNVEQAGAVGKRLTVKVLVMQGIATSIDALSVGFTISSYGAMAAFLASLIIAVVTFAVCMFGAGIGKKVGEWVMNFASILGGLILIGIGIEIFVKGI